MEPVHHPGQRQPRRGERLTIHLQPVDGRATTFRPTALEAEPGRRLRWIGRLLMPGIFDAGVEDRAAAPPQQAAGDLDMARPSGRSRAA